MKLRVIGCDGAYPTPGGACSSYLVSSGRDSILLDVGAGSLSGLLLYTRPEELAAVVLTHFHADHTSDLAVLGHYLRFAPPEPARVDLLVPADGREWPAQFEVIDYSDGSSGHRLAGGTVLGFFRNGHQPESHSIRLQSDDGTLIYTGDTAFSPELAAFASGADTVLAEATPGAGEVPEGIQHMNASGAARLAVEAGASRLVLTHLMPGTDAAAALRLAAAGFAGECLLAERGMLLEV